MDEILSFILRYWIQTLFTLMISTSAWFFKAFKNELHRQRLTMNALSFSSVVGLRKQIYDTYLKIVSDGYVAPEQYDILCDMYEAYKQLGGNHGISKLMDEVRKFPSIPPHENNNK